MVAAGAPWWHRADGQERPGARRSWPWPSTLLFTAFALVGTHFSAHAQQGHRDALDGYAYALVAVAAGLLLWRRRFPANSTSTSSRRSARAPPGS
ncbi:hypothetical protein [Streptomyces sp. NPDC056160]|uniref:hypothetical protein n=1 Tax=Streptomyces sp. NPDC056160 TaxID=3345731 RepID=UPI0035D84323